jgi:hypothetical protein
MDSQRNLSQVNLKRQSGFDSRGVSINSGFITWEKAVFQEPNAEFCQWSAWNEARWNQPVSQ